MSNTQSLYWLTRLDYINGLFLATGIIFLAVSVIIFVICAMQADFDTFQTPDVKEQRKKSRQTWKQKTKWLIPIAIISIIIRCLIPTKNEFVFIVAGGKTMDFIQKDTAINKIPSQTTAIISEFLDKQIKELKGTEEKK